MFTTNAKRGSKPPMGRLKIMRTEMWMLMRMRLKILIGRLWKKERQPKKSKEKVELKKRMKRAKEKRLAQVM